jgi:hypothetical protein
MRKAGFFRRMERLGRAGRRAPLGAPKEWAARRRPGSNRKLRGKGRVEHGDARLAAERFHSSVLLKRLEHRAFAWVHLRVAKRAWQPVGVGNRVPQLPVFLNSGGSETALRQCGR